jgi:Zn-dependent peptidase ImmA (M78 family)
MQIKNLERLSKSEIEKRAQSVLKHFNERYFEYCRPTNIGYIIRNLSDKKHLAYDEDSNLGYDSNTSKILGCYIPSKKMILIDLNLKSAIAKMHFVQAHELAHFVLHRKILQINESKDAIYDTENAFLGKRQLNSDYDFMEWQANYFASAILLPESILRSKVIAIREEIGVKWRGTVYVDDQACTREDYFQTIKNLSEYFQVSKMEVEIRLRGLDLITDNRKSKNTAVAISALIKNFTFLD